MSFKLIIISSPTSIPNETELITSLFKAGLKIFHLRKPGMSKVRMKKFISAVPQKYHSRLVIHSNPELANEFKLKGIHFPEKKRALSRTFKKKTDITFSTTLHLNNDFLSTDNYDYIFISPVFESISKPGYKSQTSLTELKSFLKKVNKMKGKKVKYFALGGICEKNIEKVAKAGFDGAGMLGAIWLSKDPVKSFEKIKKKLK